MRSSRKESFAQIRRSFLTFLILLLYFAYLLNLIFTIFSYSNQFESLGDYLAARKLEPNYTLVENFNYQAEDSVDTTAKEDKKAFEADRDEYLHELIDVKQDLTAYVPYQDKLIVIGHLPEEFISENLEIPDKAVLALKGKKVRAESLEWSDAEEDQANTPINTLFLEDLPLQTYDFQKSYLAIPYDFIDLEKTPVILTNYTHFRDALVPKVAFNELNIRAMTLNTAKKDVAKSINEINAQGFLRLKPQTVKAWRQVNFASTMTFYQVILFLIIFTILSLMTFHILMKDTIKKQLKRLSIYYISGSSLKYLRNIEMRYVVLILIPGLIFVLIKTATIQFLDFSASEKVFIKYFLPVLIVFICLLLYFFNKFIKKNINEERIAKKIKTND